MDGPIIVRDSRTQRNTLWGFLVVVFLVAAVRGFVGATTTGGRIVATTLMVLLVVGSIVGWVATHRRPAWLEIDTDAITLHRVGATAMPERLERATAGDLRFILIGPHRSPHLALTATEVDTVLSLQFFNKPEVRHACETRGWRVL